MGTGLGLSQVYGFAQQSGGLAHIRSEPGKGTSVEMHFPAAPADSSKYSEVALEPVMLQRVKPHKILVVEDDADVRRVIVECLGLIGYAVTEAAIAASKPELPVILATGYADMAAVERLAGKPAILRKPFDINSLGTAVAL